MGESFISGVVGDGDTVMTLAELTDDDDSPIGDWTARLWHEGTWFEPTRLDFRPVAAAPFPGPPGTFVVLGMGGEVLWIPDARSSAEPARRDRIGDGSLPAFTTICRYARGVAATGMGRHAHWSDGGEWRHLGTGLPLGAPGEMVGLEALAPMGGELHACGWGGEVWWLADGQWHAVPTPTNMILTSAAIGPNGQVIVCGRLGTILTGRQDQWALFDHQQTDEDFWSVTCFRQRTFLSSMRAIYELVGQRLMPVDDGSPTGSYYHLSSNERMIASIGAAAVLVSYDAETWQEIT